MTKASVKPHQAARVAGGRNVPELHTRTAALALDIVSKKIDTWYIETSNLPTMYCIEEVWPFHPLWHPRVSL